MFDFLMLPISTHLFCSLQSIIGLFKVRIPITTCCTSLTILLMIFYAALYRCVIHTLCVCFHTNMHVKHALTAFYSSFFFLFCSFYQHLRDFQENILFKEILELNLRSVVVCGRREGTSTFLFQISLNIF